MYIPGDKCRASSMLLYKDTLEKMGCTTEDCTRSTAEISSSSAQHCWNMPPRVSKQPHYTAHQEVNRKGERLLAQPSLEHHCPYCEETEKCLIFMKPAGSASVAEVSLPPLQI
jgi:hypothetical protein